MAKLIDTTVDYSTLFSVLDTFLELENQELRLAEYMQWCRHQNLQQEQPWLPEQSLFAQAPDYDIPNFSVTLECDEILDDLHESEHNDSCDTTEVLSSEPESYDLPSDDDLSFKWDNEDYFQDL